MKIGFFKIVLIGVVFSLGSVVVRSCSEKAADSKSETNQTEILAKGQSADRASKVYELTDETLYAPGAPVDRVTVLDFNTTWCVPCRKLAPVLDELAEKYADKVTFVSIDAEKWAKVADSFKVNAYPTLYVIAPDGTSQEFVGLLPASELEQAINAVLK